MKKILTALLSLFIVMQCVFSPMASALEPIGEEEMPGLYRTIGERFRLLDTWSMYLISAYENAEQDIGRKADKNRKIYNGMLKTYFYQYLGPKPPRKKQGL